MAQPTRSRQDLRVDVLKKIDPLAAVRDSSTTSAGSTTTLVDTALSPSAESEDYVGSWIYVAELQGSGPAVGAIARVISVDFSGSNNILTFAPVQLATESDMDYEIHHKVRPSIINDRLDVTLGLLRENVTLPVTIVPDGDMEASGFTDWTATADTGTNPTLTKDTATVRHGRQSLKIVANSDATNSFAKSASVDLPPGTQVIVAADVFVNTLDSAKLQLRNVTVSAEIDSAKSDVTGWVHMEFIATLPSGCEQVQVWLESPAASDITFWDHVTLWPTSDKGIDLPSHLEFLFDIESLFFYPVGTGLTGSGNDNVFRVNEGAPQFYAHSQKELDDTGVGASRFYVPSRTPTNALWIKGRKPYDIFAGADDSAKDADTTQANRYVVTNMTAASILDDLSLEATDAEKFELARKLQEKAILLRFEINHILANMTPPKPKTITTPFTRKRI